MSEHEGDGLDETLRDLVKSYNEPPATPRSEMWTAIQRRRAEATRSERPVLEFRQRRPVLQWAAGIAAVLALGIGIGRYSAGEPDAAPAVATSPTSAAAAPTTRPGAGVALELTASRHLEQSETFLTLFRAAVETNRTSDLAVGTARELLISNRFLLDSPVADEPHMRLLLQDLELVLAQIAQLPADDARGDAGLITEGMDAGSMLPRLRLVTSEGVGATLRQGAL